MSARAVVCVLAHRGACARVVLSGLDGRRDDCGVAFGELAARLGEREDCAGARGGVAGPGLDGLRAVVLMRRGALTPFMLRSGPADDCCSASAAACCEACCSASASSCHTARDLALLAPSTGTSRRCGGRASSGALPRAACADDDGPGSFDGVGNGASRPLAPNLVSTCSSFRSSTSFASFAEGGGDRQA